MFVVDFETTDTDKLYKHDNKTGEPIYYQRVWLAGYKNLETMESKYFTSLDDFMTDILARHENVDREYAIHNLQYDGTYIIPWLFKNDYIIYDCEINSGVFSVHVYALTKWLGISIQAYYTDTGY